MYFLNLDVNRNLNADLKNVSQKHRRARMHPQGEKKCSGVIYRGKL